MELVKYFAGSRALGNMSWNSDLDFVRVYTQSFEDIFAGVPLSTWDHYPKDLADMYEIVTLLTKLLWSGNSYLYSVMLADKKENVTDVWFKWEKEILDIARVGVTMYPFNRKPWFDRNIGLIDQNDDVLKRAFWCYYWVLQAKVFCEQQTFAYDMDKLIELDDSTHAGYFWDLKKSGDEVVELDYTVWMEELLELGAQSYDHPQGVDMWELDISMKKQYLCRKIAFDARTHSLYDWDCKYDLPESFR